MTLSALLAAAQTPLEMLRRGTLNPVDGFNYALARESKILKDARENTGALGTAAEVLGGGVSGGGLANAGVTAAGVLPAGAGLIPRSLAADASALGGFAGANEGNSLEERLANAGKGALGGMVAGGAFPTVGLIAKGVASPVISNVRAWGQPRGLR
jgi:hypothetical protein